jgi:hypothetical protein
MRLWGTGEYVAVAEEPKIYGAWDTVHAVVLFFITVFFSLYRVGVSIYDIPAADTIGDLAIALFSFAVLVQMHTTYLRISKERMASVARRAGEDIAVRRRNNLDFSSAQEAREAFESEDVQILEMGVYGNTRAVILRQRDKLAIRIRGDLTGTNIEHVPITALQLRALHQALANRFGDARGHTTAQEEAFVPEPVMPPSIPQTPPERRAIKIRKANEQTKEEGEKGD